MPEIGCKVCTRGDNEAVLILCDGCDEGGEVVLCGVYKGTVGEAEIAAEEGDEERENIQKEEFGRLYQNIGAK